MAELEQRAATWTYDPEADAYYVRLTDGKPSANTTAPAILDLDADGRIVGIELVSALHAVTPPDG